MVVERDVNSLNYCKYDVFCANSVSKLEMDWVKEVMEIQSLTDGTFEWQMKFLQVNIPNGFELSANKVIGKLKQYVTQTLEDGYVKLNDPNWAYNETQHATNISLVNLVHLSMKK